MLADQVAGADIAGDAQHLRQELARPQHRVALLAAEGRHARWRGLPPGRRRPAAGRSSARLTSGMSPRQTTHALASPAAPRRGRPSGWPTAPRHNPRHGRSSTGRPASASSTRSRSCPVTTMTGRAREASTLSTTRATIGTPWSSVHQQLVQRRHAAASGRRPAPAPRPAGARRGAAPGAACAAPRRAAAGGSRSPSAGRRRPCP